MSGRSLGFVDFAFGHGEEDVDKSNSSARLAVTPPQIAAAGGTGSALFVINLCASIAPVRIDGNNIPGLENYRLYQVARVEDGRTRHRLRLGFFVSESHAESVLTVVRQQYPTAFTACLCEEDRRFARGYLPESAAAAQPKPVAVQPKPATAQAKPAAAAVQPKPAAKPAAPAIAAKQAAPAEPEIVELTWEPETPAATPAASKPAAKTANAAPASKAAVGPTDGLDDFTWEPPSLTPAADAAIAKSVATGIVKAKPAADKATSDTAKHPALKLAPKAPAAKPAAPVAAKPATPVAAKPAVKPTAPPATPPLANKADTSSSMRVRTLDLTFSDPPPAQAPAQSKAPATPFHVGKGVEIKDTGIHLAAESAAAAKPKTDKAPVATKPMATPAPKVPAKVADKAAKPTHAPTAPAAAAAKPAAPLSAPAAIRITSSAPPPELDTTQTIRALTSAEMEDEQQDKWFAVQLAVSDQPVNLDAMPRLDIFEAYRLYSVATAGSGKIVHSLRLGFFKEAVSAEAVSGYLNTFFGSPTIMRVSVAEHARFKDPPSSKKPAPPVHEAKVVDFNNSRTTARPVVPTVTMEVATGVDTAATGSFKSLDTGSFKTSATGTHRALKSAAKSAGPNTKRARPHSKTGTTGRHKTLPPIEKKSLAEQLLDEAREVELSESGIRKLPKNDSLLSRMFGKLTK